MSVSTCMLYKDMYIGQMRPEVAEMILQTRKMEEVSNLKNIIFDFPPELVLRSIDEKKRIREIIQEENIDYSKYMGELRKYQTVGTAFMYFSSRSIIADGVGLGKTVEIAALINYLKKARQLTRFLMAVDTSALAQTTYELTRFTGLRVVSLPSEAYKIRKVILNTDWNKVDGIIIKHSTLRSDELSKWIALNLNEDGMCRLFNTFILDESSVIKNTSTKTAIYTKNICDICTRVHFMNATAFETSIIDIYNQVDMMYPSILPRKYKFEKEFCKYEKSFYWTKENGKPKKNFRRELREYKNQELFKERLRLVYFGRCKQDIGMDMPHIHKVYEIEASSEQLAAIEKGFRYPEVLNCPSLIPELKMENTRENVPKLDRLCSLIENEFNQSNIMIYCFHVGAQAAIAEECRKMGRKVAILNGDTTDEERWEIQLKFNKGEYDVVVTNIMKSLNLFGGDVCIFYSNNLTPSKMFQVAGRIDRNVDDRIKTYVLLLYANTDEYKHFKEVTRVRAKDSRELTIDAKTTVDYFIDAMMED